jgi:hypothetical protein
MATKNLMPSAIELALKKASGAYNQAGQDYTSSLLAGGSIEQALRRAIGESDPTLGQLRTEKSAANQRLGTVFANSIDDLKGITDPTIREQIRARRSSQYGSEADRIGGLVSDLAGGQRDTAANLSKVFDATTSARQFDVTNKRQAMQDLLGEKNTADERTFASRMDDLTRREKEASIESSKASAYRAMHPVSGGGDRVTLEEGIKNPLLAFLAGGGKRTQNEVGGYSFFDKSGKPITVDQAASMTPGGTRSDFLGGSRDAGDAQYALDPEQKKAIGALTDNIRQDPDVKDFVTVRDYYERIKSGAESKSGVGDLSVIFSYMKVLDPTSAVRETEYKNAGDAIGKIPQLANVPQQYLKGNKLTEKGRQWFQEEATKIYNLKKAQNERAISNYRGQAEGYGIDPSLVIRDYTAGQTSPSGSPASGTTSSGLKYTVTP